MDAEPDRPMSMRAWDPDKAFEASVAERAVNDVNVHDPVQVADAVDAIFRENAQVAAMGIVYTAFYEPNPRIRFDAQKYVLERATKREGGELDPLTTLVSELYAHMAREEVKSSAVEASSAEDLMRELPIHGAEDGLKYYEQPDHLDDDD
jgi:hypothetical protein